MKSSGFSLAEILIALGLIGLIAAFTVPSLLTPASSVSNQYNSAAKNAAFVVLTAYNQYKMRNGDISSNANFATFIPYMNYLKADTASAVDATNGSSITCGSGSKGCLILHNGAYLYYGTNVYFGGNSTTNGIWFGVDPSGARDSFYAEGFILTYSGRILPYGKMTSSYYYSIGGVPAQIDPPQPDATWLDWN